MNREVLQGSFDWSRVLQQALTPHTTTDDFPQRIVCLSDETTETLYMLEEDWRIVGISGFTVRPPDARSQKPVVTSFTHARIDDIIRLEPDLVLGFSDIQADIAAKLIAEGVEVHVFNHRSIDGIYRMIRMLGAMTGCGPRALALAESLGETLDEIRLRNQDLPRPRIYFEEWDDPLITGIQWVSELIDIAGGDDVMSHLSGNPLAKGRIVCDHEDVVARDPQIIIGSWCGKPFQAEQVRKRPGWQAISAVIGNEIHGLDSSIILQPGPAALTDGVRRIEEIIAQWRAKQ